MTALLAALEGTVEAAVPTFPYSLLLLKSFVSFPRFLLGSSRHFDFLHGTINVIRNTL